MAAGVSTASFFSRMNSEDSVRFLARNGVARMEVFLDTYSEYEADFAHLLRERAEDAQIVSVHAMSSQFEPQLFSLSARQRAEAWKLFEKVLNTARVVGANHYVMHGPALLFGALRNVNLRSIGPIAAQLADKAGDYGVKLCWENVSWCMFNRPEFVPGLLEHCDHDNLYFTFDIKQAVRTGLDPFDFLSAIGHRLAHVHILDYRLDEKTGKVTGLCLPGEGTFDFARLADYLRGIHYQGDCMIETYSDLYETETDVLRCFEKMKAVLG